MTLAELGLALMVLLLTPGPTNTLMLMAGLERGVIRSIALIPVELAAYFAVITPLALLTQGMAEQFGVLRPVLAVLAGFWVLYLAWSLWREDRRVADGRMVTAGRLAWTTLLNPKGVVMGLVLLPAAGATGAAFVVLALAVCAVAAFWAVLGGYLPGAGPGAAIPTLWRQVLAVWLAGLSLVIMAGGVVT